MCWGPGPCPRFDPGGVPGTQTRLALVGECPHPDRLEPRQLGSSEHLPPPPTPPDAGAWRALACSDQIQVRMPRPVCLDCGRWTGGRRRPDRPRAPPHCSVLAAAVDARPVGGVRQADWNMCGGTGSGTGHKESELVPGRGGAVVVCCVHGRRRVSEPPSRHAPVMCAGRSPLGFRSSPAFRPAGPGCHVEYHHLAKPCAACSCEYS